MDHISHSDGLIELSLSPAAGGTRLLCSHGGRQHMPDLLRSYQAKQILLISDQQVGPLYAEPLRQLLQASGYQAHGLTLPVGEEAKTLDWLTELYVGCLALRIERSAVVVAVGGGVVGDVAGMLAGTYLRGLNFIQVPTSLIAMVSASVGGKVGINFGHIKNLVGLFYPPQLVVMDFETLTTLSYDDFRAGLGELLTVAVLGAPDIFEALELTGTAHLDQLILAAIRCKCALVEADPLDQLDIRARLNLGHTFGHALEHLSNFTLSHGLAVGVGLHLASRLAAALGLCSPALVERIRHTLLALDLPATLTGYRAEALLEVMRSDKKASSGQIRWVLPVALGEVRLVSEAEVPAKVLLDVVRAVVEEGTA